MAIVILGGLATSTLMNLFVVPALYLRFGRPRPGGRDRRSELRFDGPIKPTDERQHEHAAPPATVMQSRPSGA
jgi:hypothetical protein